MAFQVLAHLAWNMSALDAPGVSISKPFSCSLVSLLSCFRLCCVFLCGLPGFGEILLAWGIGAPSYVARGVDYSRTVLKVIQSANSFSYVCGALLSCFRLSCMCL